MLGNKEWSEIFHVSTISLLLPRWCDFPGHYDGFPLSYNCKTLYNTKRQQLISRGSVGEQFPCNLHINTH